MDQLVELGSIQATHAKIEQLREKGEQAARKLNDKLVAKGNRKAIRRKLSELSFETDLYSPL